MCLLSAGKQKDENRNTKTRLTSYLHNFKCLAYFRKSIFCPFHCGVCASSFPNSTFYLSFPNMTNIAASCEEKRRKKNTPSHLVPSALEKIDHHQCRHSAHMLTFLLFNVTDTHRHTSRISWQNNLNLGNNKQAPISAQTGLRSWPLLF